MTSLFQLRTIVELSVQGWEVLRFPQPEDENIIGGGPTYMANKRHEMIVVDATGDAYKVDIGLNSAKNAPPVYTAQTPEGS